MKSRMVVLSLVLASTGCLIGDAPPPTEHTSALSTPTQTLLQWNQIAVNTVGATAPFPSTRAMATVQVAVFEAVNAINQDYTPYTGAVSAPNGGDVNAAIIVASHDTLVWLFPTQQSSLDAQRDSSLAAIPDSQKKSDGIAVGASAALAMIANRTNDGSAPPQFFTPTDTTPGQWQLTPSCAASGNRGVFFHWQNVKPFGVQSSSQFRVAPPPALTDATYTQSWLEVNSVGGINSPNRPQDRSDVAKFYAAQPPHRGWNMIARQLVSEHSDSITKVARTFAILNMSLSDAHITVFESKYHYTYWRPETAIHLADQDGNAQTNPDTTYAPYIVTPCFPGYPSAHGSGAGAAAQILAAVYGNSGHNLTVTDPGAPTITLHYSNLSDVETDVSDARVFGGIHFRYDQDVGDQMGHSVAAYNDANVLNKK